MKKNGLRYLKLQDNLPGQAVKRFLREKKTPKNPSNEK